MELQCINANNEVCELCNAQSKRPCSAESVFIGSKVHTLMGNNKQSTQRVEPDNFKVVCETETGLQAPAGFAGKFKCEVTVVSSIQNSDGTFDEVITLKVYGDSYDVADFEAGLADGFDIMVYGEFELYVSKPPSEAPTPAPTSTDPPTTAQEGALAIATCDDFKNAVRDLENPKIIVTNTVHVNFASCSKELPETDREIHEMMGNLFAEILAFSDTKENAAALVTRLNNLKYYNVGSLGGTEDLLKDCSCPAEPKELVDETSSHDDQTVLFVIFLVVAILSCCVLCYCVNSGVEEQTAKEQEKRVARDKKAIEMEKVEITQGKSQSEI